jgi:tetratricopeptide (TPR) repeat protein
MASFISFFGPTIRGRKVNDTGEKRTQSDGKGGDSGQPDNASWVTQVSRLEEFENWLDFMVRRATSKLLRNLLALAVLVWTFSYAGLWTFTKYTVDRHVTGQVDEIKTSLNRIKMIADEVIGLDFAHQKLYESAKKHFIEALEHDTTETILTHLAYVHMKQGHYPKAQDLLLKAHALNERYDTAIFNLALIHTNRAINCSKDFHCFRAHMDSSHHYLDILHYERVPEQTDLYGRMLYLKGYNYLEQAEQPWEINSLKRAYYDSALTYFKQAARQTAVKPNPDPYYRGQSLYGYTTVRALQIPLLQREAKHDYAIEAIDTLRKALEYDGVAELAYGSFGQAPDPDLNELHQYPEWKKLHQEWLQQFRE